MAMSAWTWVCAVDVRYERYSRRSCSRERRYPFIGVNSGSTGMVGSSCRRERPGRNILPCKKLGFMCEARRTLGWMVTNR